MVRLALAALLVLQPVVQAAELAPVDILLTRVIPQDQAALATAGPEKGERLAKLQSDLALVVEGLEGFASEADAQPSLKRLRESIEASEQFKDRASALDAAYRALAVVDYTWAKRLPEAPCSPEASRAALLKSDALSSWISSLLGVNAGAAAALDRASLATKASAREYALLRAKVRRLGEALGSEKAVGALRASLYCRRAAAYETLSAANRSSGLVAAARATGAADDVSGVYVLARESADGLEILGAATSIDGAIVTDARLVDSEGLVLLRRDVKKPVPVSVERREGGLALLRASDPLKGFILAETAPAKDDLIEALGHPERTGAWTRTRGLVTSADALSFQSDAVVDAGMTGGAALTEEGKLAGVFVLRRVQSGDEAFDWPVAVSAPALKSWLGGGPPAAAAGSIELAESGSASILTASRPLGEKMAVGVNATGAGYSFYQDGHRAVCVANCGDASGSNSSPSSNYGSSGGAEIGQALGQAMAPLVQALIFKGIPALFRGLGSLFKSKPRYPTAEVKSSPVQNTKPKVVEQPKPKPEFTVTLQSVRLIAGKEAVFSVKVKSNRDDIKPAGLHMKFTVDYDKETSTGTAVTDDEGNATLEVRPSAAAVAFNGLDRESERYSHLITVGRETEAGKVCRMAMPRALVIGMVTATAIVSFAPGGVVIVYGVGQGCLAAASGMALGGGVFCANEFVKEAMAPTLQPPVPIYVPAMPQPRADLKKPKDAFDAVRGRAERAVSKVDEASGHGGETNPRTTDDRSMAGGQPADPNEPPESERESEPESKRPAQSLNDAQKAKLADFEKKLPKSAGKVTVRDLPNGGKAFQSDVPAKNIPRSYARYEKQIDGMGNTTSFTKTTFGPDGQIIHVRVTDGLQKTLFLP